MGFAREHRLSAEQQRPAAEVETEAKPPHRPVPGKATEVERILARLAGAMHPSVDAAISPDPGRRTLVEPTARLGGDFDDYRVRGLRELLHRLASDDALKQDVLVAAANADRAIAGRATRWQAMPSGPVTADGAALWHASERHAVTLFRRAVAAGQVDAHDPAVESALRERGAGQPLPAELRREMERELGVSLAGVRIHTDDTAARAARVLRAEAFTIGEDIFFAAGAFVPETRSGRTLVAHELTHVAQALRGGTASDGGLRVSDPDEPLEREANTVATRFVERGGRGAAEIFAPAARRGHGLEAGTRSSTLFRSPVYPTQQEQSRVQEVVNPQHSAGSTSPVSDPAGFRNAMRDRIIAYVDSVLPGAQAIQAATTMLGSSDLASLGQVSEAQARRFFGAYLPGPAAGSGAPAGGASSSGGGSTGSGASGGGSSGDQLSQHLHFVPDSPAPAALAEAVRDWTASRMLAKGQDLIEDHHVLAGIRGTPGRDQVLFDQTQNDIIARRTSALQTIVRYAGGYERDGEAYIQPRIPAQQGESAQQTVRRGRWRTFGTTLHEMMHVLAHPNFRSAVRGLEESGLAIEGFAEYFTGEVYRDVQDRSSSDPALVAQIEGSPPPPYITPPDRVPGTYARYVDGVDRIRQILEGNEDNLRCAYFTGRVEFLGLGGWSATEATRQRTAGNVISAAALLDFSGGAGGLRLRYGRIIYGRGGPFQLDIGGGFSYLHSEPTSGGAPRSDRLGVTGDLGLRYSWPNVYVGAGLGVGGSAATQGSFNNTVRLDVVPGFEVGVVIGWLRISASSLVLIPVGGPVPERTVRVLGGVGVSGEF